MGSKLVRKSCLFCGKKFWTLKDDDFCSFVCSYKNRKVTEKKPSEDDSYDVPGMRKCHDCGRPTIDYRCAECWKEWRIKHNVNPNVVEWTAWNRIDFL